VAARSAAVPRARAWSVAVRSRRPERVHGPILGPVQLGRTGSDKPPEGRDFRSSPGFVSTAIRTSATAAASRRDASAAQVIDASARSREPPARTGASAIPAPASGWREDVNVGGVWHHTPAPAAGSLPALRRPRGPSTPAPDRTGRHANWMAAANPIVRVRAA